MDSIVDLKKFHIFQKENSIDCGPACLEIIYQSPSQKITIEEISSSMGYDEGGTYVPQILTHLIDKGIDTQLTLANVSLFTEEEGNSLNKEEKIRHLEKWFENNLNHEFSNFVVYLMIYLRHGGDIRVKPNLKARDLEKELDRGNKWLVVAHRSMLWGQNVSTKTMKYSSITGKLNKYHFVLLNDYKDGQFEIVDPYPTKLEKQINGSYWLDSSTLTNAALMSMGIFSLIRYNKKTKG